MAKQKNDDVVAGKAKALLANKKLLFTVVTIGLLLGLVFAGYYAAQKEAQRAAQPKPPGELLPSAVTPPESVLQVSKVENPAQARDALVGMAIEIEKAQGGISETDRKLG